MNPRRARGDGGIFQPRYTDRKTRETKVSAVYWIQYRQNGRVVRESSGSTKYTDAVKLLKKRHGAIAAGLPAGPDVEKTTFADLAAMLRADYAANGKRSADRAERSLAHLAEAFGQDRAIMLTSDRITAYAAARQAAGAKPATVNRELSALKRMLRLAQRAGKVGVLPYIGMLEERNTRRGFFEAEQWAAVKANLPGPLVPVFETAYITGWRVKSEILTRQRHHLDLKAGWLRLEPGETKNGDGRMFPLTPGLRSVLEAQLAATRELEQATGAIIPWLFHRDGRPIKSFRRAWQTACGKAGLSARIPHDFRRTAVRNLERAGVPRSAAMKMVGHKTQSIYSRYAIAEEGMLREAAVKLAALHDGECATPTPRVVVPLRGFGGS